MDFEAFAVRLKPRPFKTSSELNPAPFQNEFELTQYLTFLQESCPSPFSKCHPYDCFIPIETEGTRHY
jgi:hypothetical protein